MRRWTVFALALFLGFGIASNAEAKKPKPAPESTEASAEEMTVKTCGVADVDNIFMPAGDILNSVVKARTAIASLNTNLTTALGLPAGTPLKDAFADLKTKAEGKITVAMEGDAPTLKTADAVPEDVQKAIDAVNGGVKDVSMAVAALTEIPAKVTEIINAAKAINPASLTGVSPTKIPAITKTIAGNLKILTTLPDEIKNLVDASAALVTDLKATFSG